MRRLMFLASSAMSLALLMVLSAGDMAHSVPSSLLKSQADAMSVPASTRGGTILASAYHSRNRVDRFFERGTTKQKYAPVRPPAHALSTRQATVPRCPKCVFLQPGTIHK